LVGQPEKLVEERSRCGADGESGQDEELVVAELNAPRCGGDPALRTSVEAVTVFHTISVSMLLRGRSRCCRVRF
jgi:hypothetical protein